MRKIIFLVILMVMTMTGCMFQMPEVPEDKDAVEKIRIQVQGYEFLESIEGPTGMIAVPSDPNNIFMRVKVRITNLINEKITLAYGYPDRCYVVDSIGNDFNVMDSISFTELYRPEGNLVGKSITIGESVEGYLYFSVRKGLDWSHGKLYYEFDDFFVDVTYKNVEASF